MSNAYKRNLRKEVLRRDGHKCLLCGSREDLTLDHIVPKSKGGKLIYNNLQTLCKQCNASKGQRKSDLRKLTINVFCKIELPKYKKGRFK